MNKRYFVLIAIVICGVIIIFFSWSFTSGIQKSSVTEIQISQFKQFGSINDEQLVTLEDENSIKILVNAINSSTKLSGDVDMPEGDYDINILFKNNNEAGYHVWIQEEYYLGTLMSIDDTASAYRLTKKSTQNLRELLLD